MTHWLVVWSIVLAGPAEEKLPDWLAGCWSDGSGAHRSVESWARAGESDLFGLNFRRSQQGVDFEYLRIERRAGRVSYLAQPGGRPPTRFELVEAGPAYALFANDGHDYPQRIGYRRSGETIEGWISLADGTQRHAWRWSKTDCGEVF